jgi:thiamine-phosphate pyrophosphorylase
LSARDLFDLVRECVALTKGSETALLVNDRADIAIAAGADGVHLTTQSIESKFLREVVPKGFLIAVSTHSREEVRDAAESGADFVVLGPVLDTPSKRDFGPPLGVEVIKSTTREFPDTPVVALGGVNINNFRDCLAAGAAGVAGIGLFSDPDRIGEFMRRFNDNHID